MQFPHCPECQKTSRVASIASKSLSRSALSVASPPNVPIQATIPSFSTWNTIKNDGPLAPAIFVTVPRSRLTGRDPCSAPAGALAHSPRCHPSLRHAHSSDGLAPRTAYEAGRSARAPHPANGVFSLHEWTACLHEWTAWVRLRSTASRLRTWPSLRPSALDLVWFPPTQGFFNHTSGPQVSPRMASIRNQAQKHVMSTLHDVEWVESAHMAGICWHWDL